MGTPDPQSPKAPKAVPFPSERFDSWKEIARYLNRDVRTVQRWEETGGLPVYRRARGRLKGSPVYAYKSELDAWLRQNPPQAAEKETRPRPAAIAGWKTRRMLWVALSVFVLAAGGAIVWRFARSKPAAAPFRVVQLTSYPGLEWHPTFSPDGKQVAFSWNGEKQDNFDIYVKFLDAGEPLRLTTHPGMDGWPAWSPDGRRISFARWVRGAPMVDVLTVPALGGAERKILDFPIPPQPGNYIPGSCWTPDSKWFIAPYSTASTALGTLVLGSVETQEIRPLTRPVAGSAGDCCPAIAPDGRRLAFLRASEGRIFNLYVLPLGPDYQPAGEPRQLTAEPSSVENPMWTADGREVLYIASRDGVRTLWRVPHDGSRAASPLESLGPIGRYFAISPRGDRLVYSDHDLKGDIWGIDLLGGTGTRRVLSSSGMDYNPEVSPDGKRIAFVSDRARGRRVWVCDSDGAELIDLASTARLWPGPARWSPDGNQIVFECLNEGNDDICVVPAGGGAVRRLTRHPARDTLPSWSRDGKWIYFTSNRAGSFQIWKAPADGSEAGAIQLTKGSGYGPVESVDGTTVFFARERFSGSIWKVAAGGGEESQVGVFRMLGCRCQNFALGPEGIYYSSSPDPEHWFEILLYRFATGKSESICRVEKPVGDGLSVSPDGHWLLFTTETAQFGDLYMVENFR